MRILLIVLQICFLSSTLAHVVLGQQSIDETPGVGDRSATEEPNSTKVEESELETFYLEDENDKLIPYFNVPFEEFEEIYKLYKRLKAPEKPRRYTVLDLSMDGSAKGGTVDLEISIKVVSRVEGWIAIPLGMAELIIPRFDSIDQPDYFFEHDGGGYVCWIHGPADHEHQISFRAIANSQLANGNDGLAMRLPRATTSELRLVVDGQVRANVSDRRIVKDVEVLQDGNSQITLLGMEESLDLTWEPVTDPLQDRPTLHVNGDVLVTYSGPTRVKCEAVLTVRSSQTPFDSFIVRLPPEMEWVPYEQPHYTVRVMEHADANLGDSGPSKSQFVEVRLRQASSEPDEFQLQAERLLDVQSVDAPMEIGGFEVQDTLFQTGGYHLAVEGDWTLRWNAGDNVRRVEETPASLDGRGVVASFAFDGQPCSLQVQVFRKRERLNIEPTYHVLIDAEQAHLQAKLKCRLLGAKSTSISIQMAGWEVDEIDESPWVDFEATQYDRNEPFVVPLDSTLATTSEPFELTVSAHRKLDEAEQKSGRWMIRIPKPQASALQPATLVVSHAENVVLSPVTDEMDGLRAEVGPSVALAADSSQALHYRELGNSDSPTFVAEFEVRQRAVEVTGTAVLSASGDRIKVQQRWKYRIDYEPLSFVLLDVPLSLLEEGNLQWDIDKSSYVIPTREIEENEMGDGWARVRIQLAGQGVGTYDLGIAYELSFDSASNSQVPLVAQLVQPVNMGEFNIGKFLIGFDHLLIPASSNVLIQPDATAWKTDEESSSAIGSDLQHRFQFEKDAIPESISFTATTIDTPSAGSSVVQRAWVQTWLATNGREERAVFRLATNDDNVEIDLPNGARLHTLAVDGQQVANFQDNSSRVSLPLPPDSDHAWRVVEVWYFIPKGRPSRGHQVDLPHIVGSRGTRRFFWQLVLPQNEHLLSPPAELIPELHWAWRGLFWDRQGSWSQRELEDLLGATHQDDLPEASSQYVFSSFGPNVALQFSTIQRRNLLLGLAVAAFLVGWSLLNVALLRHAVVLLVLGIVLFAVALAHPELSLQIAQIAGFGLVFVLIAQLINTIVLRPNHRAAIIGGTSRAALDSTAEMTGAAVEFGSHASKASGSVVVRVSQPEPQP